MSTAIKAKIQDEVKAAMRAKEKDRLAALRLITAEFKRIEVDERVEIDDARALAILDKMYRKVQDSIVDFEKANRSDLVEKEKAIADVISAFLPTPLSEHEVTAMIDAAMQETGASNIADMGKVMAILKPQLQGRADMGQVSMKVKALLAAS